MSPSLAPRNHNYFSQTTHRFSLILYIYIPLSLLVTSVIAFPSYVQKFPNSPQWCESSGVVVGPDDYRAFGHANCNSQAGRGKYTQIGLDFMDYGRDWTLPFCLLDSDGDGYTNGEELGDPCCVYIPGEKKSPLIHKFTRSDPSSSKSAPEGSSCASLDLPQPNLADIQLLVGKTKVQLLLPDFMAQKDRACMCKSLITILPVEEGGNPTRRLEGEPGSIENINAIQFWSLTENAQSAIIEDFKAARLSIPNDLLVPPTLDMRSLNVTKLPTNIATYNQTELGTYNQLWSRPSLAASKRHLSPFSGVSDSLKGLIPPEQWRRDVAMFNLMDDLQPDGIHFPVILTEASPVICDTSIPDKVTDLSPVLLSKKARIRVQFRNWQGSGPDSTIEIPVTESSSVDTLPCSTFDLSEIPEVKSPDKIMDPCVKASILLATLLGLFLAISVVLRFVRPTSAFRHFCLRQRYMRWGGEYVSSEFLLGCFTAAIIVDLIYLTAVVMIDPTRADKTAFHNIGVATGYGSAIALAATTFLAARRHNIFHLSDPGTFEKGVKYHVVLGHIAVIMVIIHGVIKLIDSKFDFGRTGLLSGFLAGVAFLVSYIGTINYIRYKFYEVFRLLHFLMPIGLGLGMWHLIQMSDGRHIGSTISTVILGTSIGLYVIDKILSGVRDWLFKPAEVSLVRLGYTPGMADASDQHEHILMRIKQENETFLAGQWVHVWIPALGLVSHPFSVMPTTRDYDDLEDAETTAGGTPSNGLMEHYEHEENDEKYNHDTIKTRESTRRSLRISLDDDNQNGNDASNQQLSVDDKHCLIRRRKKTGFRGQFELIIRVQPDTRRFGFYTPWTRRLYHLLDQQISGVFNMLETGTLTQAQTAVERSQSTLSVAQFEAALQSKIFITRAYGPTHLCQTLLDADSVVVIAGGSGISAILGDLAALPLNKLNMFYWTFRPPFLLEWLYPQFVHVPTEKRCLFCKSFTKDYELYESPTIRKTRSIRSEVLSQSMNVEDEISNSAVRALAQWNDTGSPLSSLSSLPQVDSIPQQHESAAESSSLYCKDRLLGGPPSAPSTHGSTRSTSTTTVADFKDFNDRKPGKPTLLVLFCGPPPLKTALIQACKNERKRNRVNLILEVQSLSF